MLEFDGCMFMCVFVYIEDKENESEINNERDCNAQNVTLQNHLFIV